MNTKPPKPPLNCIVCGAKRKHNSSSCIACKEFFEQNKGNTNLKCVTGGENCVILYSETERIEERCKFCWLEKCEHLKMRITRNPDLKPQLPIRPPKQVKRLGMCRVCGRETDAHMISCTVCRNFHREYKDRRKEFKCVVGDKKCKIDTVDPCRHCWMKKCLRSRLRGAPLVKQVSDKNGVCQVCGTSAQFMHFGVRCCDPCYKFFGNKKNEMSLLPVCSIKNCEINHENKPHCRYCRMKKCLDLGMTMLNQTSQSLSPSSEVLESDDSQTEPSSQGTDSSDDEVTSQPGLDGLPTGKDPAKDPAGIDHKDPLPEKNEESPFCVVTRQTFRKFDFGDLVYSKTTVNPNTGITLEMVPMEKIVNQITKAFEENCKYLNFDLKDMEVRKLECTKTSLHQHYFHEFLIHIDDIVDFIRQIPSDDCLKAKKEIFKLEKKLFSIHLIWCVKGFNDNRFFFKNGKFLNLESLVELFNLQFVTNLFNLTTRFQDLKLSNCEIALFILCILSSGAENQKCREYHSKYTSMLRGELLKNREGEEIYEKLQTILIEFSEISTDHDKIMDRYVENRGAYKIPNFIYKVLGKT